MTSGRRDTGARSACSLVASAHAKLPTHGVSTFDVVADREAGSLAVVVAWVGVDALSGWNLAWNATPMPTFVAAVWSRSPSQVRTECFRSHVEPSDAQKRSCIEDETQVCDLGVFAGPQIALRLDDRPGSSHEHRSV